MVVVHIPKHTQHDLQYLGDGLEGYLGLKFISLKSLLCCRDLLLVLDRASVCICYMTFV